MPTQNEVAARIDRLPITRFHAALLIISSLSLLVDTLDTVVTGFILAHLRSQWHLTNFSIAIVSAIGLTGFMIGSFCVGFISDRYGRKTTILATLILYSLLCAARGFSDSLTTFAILNFFAWLFVGAETAVIPPYLAELWPTRQRGKLTGWMMAFFGFGVALSPVWALEIIPTLGWRWALWLTAPFAFFGGVMRWSLPESPRWLVQTGQLERAERTLIDIEARVERHSKAPLPPIASHLPPASSQLKKATPSDLLHASYKSRTLMLWTAWFAEYGILYAFMTFVPTLLANEGHTVVRSFGFSVVIYAGFIPGYVVGGYVLKWIDRKYSMLLCFALIAIFGTLFGQSTTADSIMYFGGLTAFFLAVGSTAIYTYTPELYPTEIRATGMGIASAWGRLGAIALMLIFGIFAVAQGKLMLFIISDGILAIAFVVVLVFGPVTRGRTLEQTSARQ